MVPRVNALQDQVLSWWSVLLRPCQNRPLWGLWVLNQSELDGDWTGCSQMFLQVVPSTRQRQLNRPGPTTRPAGLLSSMPPPSGCTALVGCCLLHFHPHCPHWLCCCATGFVISDDTPASLSRPATPTSMGHTGSVGGAKSPEDINSDRLHLILGTGLFHIHD